jgi:hypothetical protein
MSTFDESDQTHDVAIETELKRLRPKAPPEDLVQRVLAVRHARIREAWSPVQAQRQQRTALMNWSWLNSWLVRRARWQPWLLPQRFL